MGEEAERREMRRNKKEFLSQRRKGAKFGTKKPGELALRRALSLSDD